MHKNRRPQGTSTPTPSVGNLVTYTSPADFQTKWAAAVSGDVLYPHASFVAGAPMQINMRSFAAPGVTLIGHPSQAAVVRGNGNANCRVEFESWYFSGVAYQGNTNPAVAYEYSDVDLNDCSMIAFRNCLFGQGDWGIMLRGGSGCADITVDYCLFYFQMIDCIRIMNGGATNRPVVTNSYFTDLTHQEKTWAKSDGTAPIISSANPGGGYTDLTPYNEHHDVIQANGAGTGTLNDARIQNNTMKARGGQAILLADSILNRGLVADNDIQVGQSWAIFLDQATDYEMSRNAMARTASFDPNVAIGVNFVRPGGVGNAKGGLNTFTGSKSITNDTGINLEGAITGTATAPTAPTWDRTTANIQNLPALRVTLPTRADYSGSAYCVRPPKLYVDGTAGPFAPGSFIKIYHDEIIGFVYPFPSCWIRWKKDGVVQTSASYTSGGSTAAMVSPSTTAGSWVGGFSFDSTDGTNGTWYDSASVTVAAATTTMDPSRKSGEITLSGGNLIATHSGTDATQALAHSIGSVPIANGTWFVEKCFVPVAGSQGGIALVGPAKATNIDPHDFSGPCLAIFGDGNTYGSNGIGFNVGGMTGGNANYGATKWYGVTIIRSGTAGEVVKMYLQFPDGSYSTGGGAPGVGAGHDISAAFAASTISFPGYTYKTGDVDTINFGASAYTRTKPGGASNWPLT